MTRSIFVNLPVADLKKSRNFYEAIGFEINELFSDDTAACVIISETIYVMILTHAKFAAFTQLPIGDATQQTQHLIALSCDTKLNVDDIVTAALDAGGTEPRPVHDIGFMYSRSFADLDGHIWEPLWMDQAAAESGPPDAG